MLVSGDAQLSSPRGMRCSARALPTSLRLHLPEETDEVVDSSVHVHTGVLATDGLADKLTYQHCGRKFKRGCGLAQHLKSCSKRPLPHSNPDLVCPDCQRVFQRPCGLAQHRKTCPNRQATSADDTSGNTEVVCPKCQRRFKRPCGLGRHILRWWSRATSPGCFSQLRP